jgi:hypothetical protein
VTNNQFINEMLEMPPKKRRHLRIFAGRIRKNKTYAICRGDWNKESIIKWLKDHNIKTVRQLINARRDGDPSMHLIKKLFGKWSTCMLDVWGHKKIELPFKVTDAYLINVVSSFDIKTIKQYEKLYISRPDIVPSYYYVRKHFKLWRNLRYAARVSSFGGIVEVYMKMKQKKGRWPTLIECAHMKVDIMPLVSLHGSKQEFDKFLEELGEQNEK